MKKIILLIIFLCLSVICNISYSEEDTFAYAYCKRLCVEKNCSYRDSDFVSLTKEERSKCPSCGSSKICVDYKRNYLTNTQETNSTPTAVSAEQPTSKALQDIEDLFITDRITKEEYLRMKQNVLRLGQGKAQVAQPVDTTPVTYNRVFDPASAYQRLDYLSKTQGKEAVNEYINSFTPEERESVTRFAEAIQRKQQNQAFWGGLGKGLTAMGNSMKQNQPKKTYIYSNKNFGIGNPKYNPNAIVVEEER